MKQTVQTSNSTIGELAAMLDRLRLMGAPESAEIRVLVRASFHPDGGYARKATAKWDAS